MKEFIKSLFYSGWADTDDTFAPYAIYLLICLVIFQLRLLISQTSFIQIVFTVVSLLALTWYMFQNRKDYLATKKE